MKVATARQMREIDERAINEAGIAGIALMERAGSAALDTICRHFGPIRGRRVAVLCGGGNNGGDGFVVARYAANRGADVDVLLLADRERVKGDARANLEVLETLGREIVKIRDEGGRDRLRACLSGAHIIVDALLGSGLSGEVKGVYRMGIEEINRAGAGVVSIDNPSGIDMDNGGVLGDAVRSDLTLTFGLPKRGHFLYPGREYRGTLEVIDIGLPGEVIDAEGITLRTLGADDAGDMLPGRRADAHKGDCGRLLVLAGSTGYTGAAALSAESALRAGAGLVTLGIPESLNHLMEMKLTEVITTPLPEMRGGSLSEEAIEPVMRLLERMDAMVMGPGLSTRDGTGALVREILRRYNGPVVLDADGINAMIDRSDELGGRSGHTILTPHPGELGRLVGMTGVEINAHRVDVCTEFAKKWGVVLVLKGAPTIISDPGGRAFINTTGNSGLATGGTGDVLSGAIGGLLVQGIDPFHAALCGVYYHGLAGDIAAKEVGKRGMIAGDVMRALPRAIGA